MNTELAENLMDHLLACLNARDNRPPEYRWVMSTEWYQEALKMQDSFGHPIWVPTPGHETLFGYPVEIRDDAGVPKLVKE